ncbi:MAG: HEAT repeat domain-containing protein, partial [Candidatus Omnitrophica bacterium]|nr:HEAT repeat domain-containing protein [Candidatus Omnitrophota bacterium]
MERRKNTALFRAMSLVLLVAFLAVDLSHAYGAGYDPTSSTTLAAPSVMQDHPMSANAANLRQIVSYQGVILASICEIGDIFFGDPDFGKITHPEKYVKDAVMSDLGRQLNEMGIELLNIVPIEYIRATAPEKLKAALADIGFEGTLPDEGVIFALYRKNGERFLVQIAKRDEVASENLPGYEQAGFDRYLIKYVIEDYKIRTEQDTSEIDRKPEPAGKVDIVPKTEGTQESKLRSFEPFSFILVASMARGMMNGLLEFSLEHWLLAGGIGVVTVLTVWRAFFPVSWYIFNLKIGNVGRARKSLVALGSRAVPSLIKVVEKNGVATENALGILGSIGPGAQIAIPSIIRELRNKNLDIRQVAAETLDELNWKPDNDEDRIAYLIAKKEWEDIVAIGQTAVPSLVKAFYRERNRNFRASVIDALVDIKLDPAKRDDVSIIKGALVNSGSFSDEEMMSIVVCLAADVDFKGIYIPGTTHKEEREVSWDDSYGLKYVPTYETVEVVDSLESFQFRYRSTDVYEVLKSNPDFWDNGGVSGISGSITSPSGIRETPETKAQVTRKTMASSVNLDPRYAPDVPFWELDASSAGKVNARPSSQDRRTSGNLRELLDARSWVWGALSDGDKEKALNKILRVQERIPDIISEYHGYSATFAGREVVSICLAGSFPWVEAPNDLDVIIIVEGDKDFESISSAASQGSLKEIFPGLETTYEIVGLETLKKAVRGENVKRAKVVRRKAIIYSGAVPLYGVDLFRNSRPPLEAYGTMIDDFAINAQTANWDNIKGHPDKVRAKRDWRQREAEALANWMVKEKFAAEHKKTSRQTKLFSVEPFSVFAVASSMGWFASSGLIGFLREHWFLSAVGIVVGFFVGWLFLEIMWMVLFPVSWHISHLQDSQGSNVDLKTLGRRAVPALIRVVKKNNAKKISAIKGLGSIGADAKDAVPCLVAELENEKSDVWEFAAIALAKIDPADQRVVPFLIKALKNRFVMNEAIEALGNIGPAAKDAVPSLVALLKSEYEAEREIAAKALGKIGAAAKDAVPSLVALLKSEYKAEREIAAEALGKIGAAAKDAAPSLVALLEDGRYAVREVAAQTLDKLNWKPDNIEDQIAYLAAKNDWNSIVAIGRPAVPSLAVLLESKYEFVREPAAQVLGQIGATANEAISALVAALKNKDVFVRALVAKALGQIGVAAKDAISGLVAALKDEAPVVRAAAAQALDKQNWKPDSDEDRSAYLIAKKDWNGVVAMGQSAVPNLILLLKDRWPFMREVAAQTLDKLNWKPDNDEDRIAYLIAKKEWEDIIAIGQNAVPSLVKAFHREREEGLRAEMVDAIGGIICRGRLPLARYLSDSRLEHLVVCLVANLDFRYEHIRESAHWVEEEVEEEDSYGKTYLTMRSEKV